MSESVSLAWMLRYFRSKSALPPNSDIVERNGHVSFGPILLQKSAASLYRPG